MTGNTGTEIRYAAAPTQTQSKYGSQVKERLSEIGQNTRRSAPIIKAIKTAMKKTDDPFTQVGQQKSYAPQQEENQIGAQIEGIASAAQDAVSEGVAQAESAVESYRKSSNQKAAERRAERQAELKAARDERAALRGDVKKLFARDKRMYGNTVPKGSMGSGSKPGPAVDTRPRHSEGGPGDQPKVSKFEKPKGGQGGLNLGTTTLRQGEKPTGPAVKVTNYRDIRQKRLAAKDAARQAKKEGTTKAVNASTFKQKNVRGSGVPGKSGKDESARPKQVANLPSNYKATEAKAFAQAKAFQEAKKIAQRNPNVSVGVDSKGRPTATANQKTRSEAGARTAQANKARVQNNARARAQAAAVKRKLSGKSISQTKAANRASMKQAAAARHASFKKAKAAGTHARTASAQRARNKAAAKARAKAAAKARNKAKANRGRRGGTRKGRRRGRRCDIFLKFDISLLTNNNLRHDELAEVAYFVRALREVEL
jgi:hypothetical protein